MSKQPLTDIANEFRPDRIYTEFMDAGNDYADKNAAAAMLEESKKSFLSELKLRSEQKSDAAKETDALASRAYQDHVRNMVEARRLADRAKVRWISVQALAEMRRTEESSRRQEMRFVQQGGAT